MDSSALVKRYSDEAGSDAVHGLTGVIVSALARVEVPAALWRKHRIGELGLRATQTLVDEFEADLFGDADEPPRFAVVAVTATLLDEAAALTAVAPVRTLDAVQLASALAARRADPTLTQFACFDSRLARAALTHGFARPRQF